MKKIYNLTVIIILTTILVSCGTSTNNQGEENTNKEHGNNAFSYTEVERRTIEIKDNETGCKYLFFRDKTGGGLTLMYDENGEPSCGKEE